MLGTPTGPRTQPGGIGAWACKGTVRPTQSAAGITLIEHRTHFRWCFAHVLVNNKTSGNEQHAVASCGSVVFEDCSAIDTRHTWLVAVVGFNAHSAQVDASPIGFSHELVNLLHLHLRQRAPAAVDRCDKGPTTRHPVNNSETHTHT